MIVLMLGTLGLVLFISFRIQRLQSATALALFMVYAALLGLSLSSIFLVYTGASITRVFFISAASFGALSLYGYTTQRDLSAMGSFLIMGLFGLDHREPGQYVLAELGAVVHHLGRRRRSSPASPPTTRSDQGDVQLDGRRHRRGRKAVMGALSLYLDFINLFLFLLRLFGDRR